MKYGDLVPGDLIIFDQPPARRVRVDVILLLHVSHHKRIGGMQISITAYQVSDDASFSKFFMNSYWAYVDDRIRSGVKVIRQGKLIN